MTRIIPNKILTFAAKIVPSMHAGLVVIVLITTLSASIPQVQAAGSLVGWFYRPTTETVKTLPQSQNRAAVRTIKVSVTAYNSEPAQTDSTPYNTADGTWVRDGIVAANFLPLGTRVKFPDLYGDKEFVVKDRMNARYHKRADIWMEHKPDAIDFGHQYTTMEIYR